MSLNEFRAQFLDKAQFCPEFLENDQLLKEQFYLKLKKSLREKISLRQMESFSMLADVARDHEIEMARVDESDLKRKHEDVNSPNKRYRQEGSSGNNSHKKSVPICRQCKRNHWGCVKHQKKVVILVENRGIQAGSASQSLKSPYIVLNALKRVT